jgi:hypothetical protein
MPLVEQPGWFDEGDAESSAARCEILAVIEDLQMGRRESEGT